MTRFEVQAYESGCSYSNRVMELFKKSGIKYRLKTYKRGDAPYHKVISTMPRVFFDGTLVANCESLFQAVEYVKGQFSRGWSEKNTKAFKGKLIGSLDKKKKTVYKLIESTIPLAKVL